VIEFPAGAGNFPLRHRAQTRFGAQSVSYAMDERGSYPGRKAAEALS
jgi:hypothetical protein